MSAVFLYKIYFQHLLRLPFKVNMLSTYRQLLTCTDSIRLVVFTIFIEPLF